MGSGGAEEEDSRGTPRHIEQVSSGPDGVSYRLIRATGGCALRSNSEGTGGGKMPEELQAIKVVMISKPSKDHSKAPRVVPDQPYKLQRKLAEKVVRPPACKPRPP